MSSTPSLSVEDEKKLQAGDVEDQPTLPYTQEVPDVDPEMSRRLVRKFDKWLLPLIAIMYLCNNLDKSNLANAKTDHFDKDIHLKGNQYYTIITVFYAPLCIAAVPMMLMIKRFGAYRMLPAMALTFGTLSMCSAAVTKFSDILAIRFFLAISESSCLPGVTFYFSTFYTRGEIASRVGIFFAMASFAGAFGGLIAYGIFQAHNIALKGWQIMFLAEGGLTVVVAFLMFLILPKSPSEARFLTPEEKEAARNRLLKDSSNQLESATDVRGAFRALATPMTLMWIVTVFCVSVPLTSIANFLPQIVARLGYGTVKTNLLTVAPNLVGAVSLAILTMSSDYFRERAIHLFIPVGFMFVGFMTLWALDPLKDTAASYFCCFLLGAGVSTPPVLISAWSANNMMDETQRAVLLALIIGFGNTAGLVTSNIFRAKDEPRYTPALAAAAVFSVVGMGLVASLGGWMRWDNRKRNRAQGVNLRSQDVETKILLEGPKNPSFRWMC